MRVSISQKTKTTAIPNTSSKRQNFPWPTGPLQGTRKVREMRWSSQDRRKNASTLGTVMASLDCSAPNTDSPSQPPLRELPHPQPTQPSQAHGAGPQHSSHSAHSWRGSLASSFQSQPPRLRPKPSGPLLIFCLHPHILSTGKPKPALHPCTSHHLLATILVSVPLALLSPGPHCTDSTSQTSKAMNGIS